MRQFKNLLTTDPRAVEDGDAFIIKIVAAAGYGNDWAAYWGPGHWPDSEVADHGTKLPKDQVAPLFYVMRHSGRYYRS